MKRRESNETPSPKRVGDGQKFGESVLTCLKCLGDLKNFGESFFATAKHVGGL